MNELCFTPYQRDTVRELHGNLWNNHLIKQSSELYREIVMEKGSCLHLSTSINLTDMCPLCYKSLVMIQDPILNNSALEYRLYACSSCEHKLVDSAMGISFKAFNVYCCMLHEGR